MVLVMGNENTCCNLWDVDFVIKKNENIGGGNRVGKINCSLKTFIGSLSFQSK